MIYRLVKVLMTVALRFFYRRIYVTGTEIIPSQGPAILLANHPSALMDAALIGILSHRPVYFFTKGDVFINKPVNIILKALHMIPIHHHEAGRSSLNINDDSYTAAEEILSAGGIILFFPEGNSKTDHRLMPLRKGVFRMAFHAAASNNFKYNIPFIPVGINYEHPTAGNRDVMVHFNKPFFLNDYKEAFGTNAPATLLQMTKDGFAALENNVLHIENPDNFELAEQVLAVNRNNYYFFTSGWRQATVRRFNMEKNICNGINGMQEPENALLKTKAREYFEELKKHGLKDSTVCPYFHFSNYKRWQIVRGVPFFFISWILNALPFMAGRRIADKMVQRIDFCSWILVGVSLLFYIVWVLLLCAGFSVMGWRYAVGIPLFTMLTGLFYYAYKKWWKEFRQYRQLKTQLKQNPGLLLQLRALRNELLFTNGPR